MMRSVVSNLFTFLIVALAVLAGAIFWGQRTYVSQGPLEQAICLRVAPGENMGAVSARLGGRRALAKEASPVNPDRRDVERHISDRRRSQGDATSTPMETARAHLEATPPERQPGQSRAGARSARPALPSFSQ